MGGLDGAEQEDLWMVGEAALPAGGKARGEGGDDSAFCCLVIEKDVFES